MNQQPEKAESFKTRSARNSIRMLIWIIIWTVTMVLADKAELYQWYSADWTKIAAIAINFICGLMMILTFVRYLKGLDELQRKIQLDSLAFSMGMGLVGSFSYSLLVTTGFVTDSEVSDIILLMTFTYMASVVFGQVRYR